MTFFSLNMFLLHKSSLMCQIFPRESDGVGGGERMMIGGGLFSIFIRQFDGKPILKRELIMQKILKPSRPQMMQHMSLVLLSLAKIA
jgi:hypothetical protein